MSATVTPTVQRVTVSPTAQTVTLTPTVQRVDVYPDTDLPVLADVLADLVTATATVGISAAPTDIGTGADQLRQDVELANLGSTAAAQAHRTAYSGGTIGADVTEILASASAEAASIGLVRADVGGASPGGGIRPNLAALATDIDAQRAALGADAEALDGDAAATTIAAAETRIAAAAAVVGAPADSTHAQLLAALKQHRVAYAGGTIAADATELDASTADELARIAAIRTDLDGGVSTGVVRAELDTIAAGATTALADTNTTDLRTGGAGTYTAITTGAAAMAAKSRRSILAGSLTWIRHDANPAGRVTGTGADTPITITPLAGETVTMSALITNAKDVLSAADVWTMIVEPLEIATADHVASFGLIIDADGLQTINVPALHRTAGSVATNTMWLCGCFFQRDAGAPTWYAGAAHKFFSDAEAVSTPASGTTAYPINKKYNCNGTLVHFHDGGSYDSVLSGEQWGFGIGQGNVSGWGFNARALSRALREFNPATYRSVRFFAQVSGQSSYRVHRCGFTEEVAQ